MVLVLMRWPELLFILVNLAISKHPFHCRIMVYINVFIYDHQNELNEVCHFGRALVAIKIILVVSFVSALCVHYGWCNRTDIGGNLHLRELPFNMTLVCTNPYNERRFNSLFRIFCWIGFFFVEYYVYDNKILITFLQGN